MSEYSPPITLSGPKVINTITDKGYGISEALSNTFFVPNTNSAPNAPTLTTSTIPNLISDGQKVSTNISIAVGSNILTASSSVFSIADVGKILAVARTDCYLGVSPWYSTDVAHVVIKAFISTYSVIVSQVGSASPNNFGSVNQTQSWPYSSTPCTLMWGTDNSPALQTALTSIGKAGGGTIVIPPGNFVFGTQVAVYSNTSIVGSGKTSNLMLCGIATSGSSANSEVSPLFINIYQLTWNPNPQFIPNYTAASFAATYGDHDITFSNLSFDASISGAAYQAICSRMLFVTRTGFSNCYAQGTQYAPFEAFNFFGCHQFYIRDCSFVNPGFVLQPYIGWTDGDISNNYIYLSYWGVTSPTSSIANFVPTGISFNSVGVTIAGVPSLQSASNLSIRNNTIYLNGSGNSANTPLALQLFPDGTACPIQNVIISGNKVYSTGSYNLGLQINGTGTNVLISNNEFVSLDGTAFTPIGVAYQPDATNGLPTVAATTGGSSSVTLTWAAHGIPTTSAFPLYLRTSAQTSVGGLTLSGVYPITSIPSANSIVFNAGSNAGSTATASIGGSTFWQIREYPASITISNNKFLDCINSTQGLIYTQGSNLVIANNDFAFSSGATTGSFISLIQVDSINASLGNNLVSYNSGPTGTLSLPSGYLGNNRVCYGQYTQYPIIIDTNVAGGNFIIDNAGLTVSGATPAITLYETASGRTAGFLSSDGFNLTLSSGIGNMTLTDGSASIVMSAGTITLSSLQLTNVPYTAGAPSATGYLTITDSAGVNRKILCA
jgi:hypothetical protein